jgi:imidazolonepropionase-like amidohydrolase
MNIRCLMPRLALAVLAAAEWTQFASQSSYRLLMRAGLTFREVLASLTTVPATRLRITASPGRIVPGSAADLVFLHDDPQDDIAHFADVELAIRDGRVIYSAKRNP